MVAVAAVATGLEQYSTTYQPAHEMPGHKHVSVSGPTATPTSSRPENPLSPDLQVHDLIRQLQDKITKLRALSACEACPERSPCPTTPEQTSQNNATTRPCEPQPCTPTSNPIPSALHNGKSDQPTTTVIHRLLAWMFGWATWSVMPLPWGTMPCTGRHPPHPRVRLHFEPSTEHCLPNSPTKFNSSTKSNVTSPSLLPLSPLTYPAFWVARWNFSFGYLLWIIGSLAALAQGYGVEDVLP